MRQSIQFRYSIAKWYYSVIVRQQGNGGVFLPIWYQFPEDDRAYRREDQFLIGSELMFVSNPDDDDEVEVYNPTHGQICLLSSGRCYSKTLLSLANPLPDALLAFILPGAAIQFQPFSSSILNTYSLSSTFHLYAHLSPLSSTSFHASG